MNIKKFKIWLWAFALLTLPLPISNPSAKPHSVAVKEHDSDTATVLKILDGDTFIISGDRRIRLLGVDTPEKGEPYSDTARYFADSLLQGRHISIEFEKTKKDKYGRLLGYVYIDNHFFNELLLDHGLARLYLFKAAKKHNRELISAQKRARNQKRGIWSLPEPDREPFYISAGGSFRFHRPLCPLIKGINTQKAKRYKTRDSALDDGLSPCRECRP